MIQQIFSDCKRSADDHLRHILEEKEGKFFHTFLSSGSSRLILQGENLGPAVVLSWF